MDLYAQLLETSKNFPEGHASLVPVMCEGQLNAESLEWMKPPDQSGIIQDLLQATVEEIPHILQAFCSIDPKSLTNVCDVMLDLHL